MVAWGSLEPPNTIVEIEVDLNQVLAELTADIKTHPGEFILIVQRTLATERGSGGCFGSDWDHERVVLLTLGVIAPTDTDFRLTGESTSLPTERYYIDPGSSYRPGQVTAGAWKCYLFSKSLHGRSLGSPIQLSDGLTTAPRWELLGYSSNPYVGEKTLEIVVGDEAVEAWFNQKVPGVLWPEVRPLWFQQSAELLGRPLDHAPELAASRQRERSRLIQNLWQLNDEAAVYRRRLESYRQARQGSGVYSQDGAIGLIEDDDDLRVVSMGSNRELDQLTAKIKRLINRARELGLGEHPVVAAFAVFYQVDDDSIERVSP